MSNSKQNFYTIVLLKTILSTGISIDILLQKVSLVKCHGVPPYVILIDNLFPNLNLFYLYSIQIENYTELSDHHMMQHTTYFLKNFGLQHFDYQLPAQETQQK